MLNLHPEDSVQPATPNARGFDTDTKLTASTAAAFAKAGFTFAIRYLSRGTSESSGDLTSQETRDILGAGLALMAVQHVQSSGWWPTAQLGQQYGQDAVNNAQSAGLPPGVSLWLDLEGVNTGASASDVSAYCNAWSNEVAGAHYLPGLYLGYDSILDIEQLDTLQIQYYWRSGGDSEQSGSSFEYPYPPNGFCVVQSIGGSYAIDQVAYDLDVIQADNLGATPRWLAPHSRRIASLRRETPDPETPATSATAGSGTGASDPAAEAPKTRSLGRIAVFSIAGILLYALGVLTGPVVLPNGQSALPALWQELAVSKAAPVPAPASPTPAPSPSSSTVTPEATAPPAASAAPQSVLVGSYSDSENAGRLARTLESAGLGHPTVSTADVGGKQWMVVRLGPYKERGEADRIAAQLKENYPNYHLHPTVQPGSQ